MSEPLVHTHGAASGAGPAGRRLRVGTVGEPPLLPAYREALNRLAVDERLDSDDPELVLVSTLAVLDRERIAGLPSLRHVVVYGTSLGRLDLEALAERGVTWSNVTHYGDHPAAEVAFMQLVGLARGLGPYQWRREPHELAGKRCTIVGMGDLGRSMAGLAFAYRMRVSYASRSRKPDLDALGATYGTRSELLPHADIVILTGPTDVEVLSAADVSMLPDGAILVQASGGHAFDDAAFLDWIGRDENHAVFDLATGEEAFARYASLPRVVFPRVNGGLSHEARERVGAAVVRLVRSLTTGVAG